jgi:NAD+ diphosphatase
MLKTPASFTPLIAPQIFCGDELLVHGDSLALPGPDTAEALGLKDAQFYPVGLLGDRYCQTAWLPRPAAGIAAASLLGDNPQGLAFRKLRALFGAMDDDVLAVAGRAFQISDWARTHRFCGSCGSPTTHVAGERCVKCPACGFMAYPRISPAMMVLIKKGDSILLARHAASPAPFFTALAGFLEAGESVEEAIHREVQEEVGLKVRNITYFGSQTWPFPHSLMIAFTAEYDGGDITVDENEIAEARWFGPGDTVPRIPVGISIAGELITAHLPANAVMGMRA